MFLTPLRNADPKLLVKLLIPDGPLATRRAAALEATGHYYVEQVGGGLAELAASPESANIASLLVVTIDPANPGELMTLETLLPRTATSPPTVVLADGLPEAAVRRLLKLQVVDWLATSCPDREFIAACEQALRPAPNIAPQNAKCTTFVSAQGGAGATTLSLAAASVFAGKGAAGLDNCCVVDLDFQSGTLANYLDLVPNLQLGDIAATPERLDAHLLEIMLSRHASKLAILAAPPSFTGLETIRPDLVAQLLDLASQRFGNVVIDLPRFGLSRCENVVRGTDALYIVAELTVVGLRQARVLADMLEQSCGISTKHCVIFNKVRWFGSGLSKRHAREVLGDRVAGFVGDCSRLVQDAQNRGLSLSQVKKRNRIEVELGAILREGRRITAEARAA